MLINKKKSSINREYLYYLMNDLGLLNDYELDNLDISYEDYEDPDDEMIAKLENYHDTKK